MPFLLLAWLFVLYDPCFEEPSIGVPADARFGIGGEGGAARLTQFPNKVLNDTEGQVMDAADSACRVVAPLFLAVACVSAAAMQHEQPNRLERAVPAERPSLDGRAMKPSFDYHRIRGILPTVLTPYDDEEQVDPEALRAQIRYLLQAGVHGVVIMGSIGEGPYLSDRDREVVIRTTVEAVNGQVPVLVGIAADSTFVATEQLRAAHEMGASAVMVCLPQYFTLQFEDVERHYTRLSELDLLPIFYYHYPAATRLELKPAQIAELLAIPNVVGIKESTFDMSAIKRHIELTQGLDRVFLSGSELNFVQFMDLGGHGAVSAGSLLMPRTAIAMYNAYMSKDSDGASRLQAQMFETMPLVKDTTAPIALARPAFLQALRQGLNVPLGIDPAQARLKAALAIRGIPIKPVVRSPLHPITPRDVRIVQQAMRKIEQIEPKIDAKPAGENEGGR